MKINQKTGFLLFIVAVFIFEVIFIASIFYEPKDLKSINLSLDQKVAMIDINILCTTYKNHLLFNKQEVCFYIPHLKELIVENGK